jgi:hypothetical protein
VARSTRSKTNLNYRPGGREIRTGPLDRNIFFGRVEVAFLGSFLVTYNTTLRIPRYTMPDPQAQCSCVEEAVDACERVENILEFSLDAIITASAQTIDFALQSQQCQLHSRSSAMEVKNSLLRICARLVVFIQRAVISHTEATQLNNTPESELHNADGQNAPERLEHRLIATTGTRELRSLPQVTQTPVAAVVYIPSKMALGEHELDVWQSKYLALYVCCRILRNFATVLQRIEGQDTVEIGKVDGRVLAIFFQMTRIVETASSTLHSFTGKN